MPGVSREQVEQARRITAIEYLQRYEAYDLKRCGHDEYELISHDSFKINTRTSKWHWKSRDQGGVSALDFLIHVRGQAFTDSVRMLCNKSPSLVPVPSIQKDKNPFILPKAAPDCVRASTYLRSRGISQNVLAYYREQGLFYEDIPYHNVVFVANDITGKPRFACKRGTCGVNYKRDVEGSEKRFGCYILPATEISTEYGTGNSSDGNINVNTANGTDNTFVDNIEQCTENGTVAIYESIIDAMSHATLDELDGLPWDNKSRLALGGIYAPDPSKAPSVRRPTKPPAALEQFLSDHPQIRNIEICTDNDFAGRYAANRIYEHYKGSYNVTIVLPVPEGHDYNDMAVERMKMRSRSMTAER